MIKCFIHIKLNEIIKLNERDIKRERECAWMCVCVCVRERSRKERKQLSYLAKGQIMAANKSLSYNNYLQVGAEIRQVIM